MALKLTMRPFETIFINGAEIINGDRNTSLVINNICRLLRESEMVKEADVTTPCTRMAFVLQQIVLKEHPVEEMNEMAQLSIQILQDLPSLASEILEIQQLLGNRKNHAAFKKAKALIPIESQALSDQTSDKGAAA